MDVREIKLSHLPVKLRREALQETFRITSESSDVMALEYLIYCVVNDIEVLGCFNFERTLRGYDYWYNRLSEVAEDITIKEIKVFCN